MVFLPFEIPVISNGMRKLVPSRLRRRIRSSLERRYRRTFSKCGEDAILRYLFKLKEIGFYVDVGAYHPINVSNTYVFYRDGWRGINIDARPGSMNEFNKERPRDINVEAAISERPENLIYYAFGENKDSNRQELNTFNRSFAEHQLGALSIETNEVELTTQTLAEVFDLYLDSVDIDFISIDVEGMEIDVLRSNNWEIYRPKVVLVESFDRMSEKDFDYETSLYLSMLGYRILAKTLNGVFFLENTVSLSRSNQILI
jgi:FkbM family methyltransferase